MRNRRPKIELCHNDPIDRPQDWWWRIKGGNGEIMVFSESYTKKASAKRSAKRMYALMDQKAVDFVEVP